MKLLVISNGHGEDIIAVRIIEQLRIIFNNLEIAALPLVGRGYAYQKSQIPIVGKVQIMPSGGFVYMSKNQLFSDLKGGLLQLTVEQLKVVKQWGKNKQPVLAVGDIVPLLFALLSGCDYAFVGTAKSEYYLRDSNGDWLAQTSWLEKQFGSVYLPWERWLMSRAVAVYPRDGLTTKILQQQGIDASNLGNPMMDGLKITPTVKRWQQPFKILLLPGSRETEALANWQQILAAVSAILDEFIDYHFLFYAAIAPGLKITAFQEILMVDHWQLKINEEKMIFEQRQATLCLAQNAYQEYLQEANLAIAMAGTATEQFVGLGKPVITMPGNGPQCTFAFMEAQSRLLGCSILLRETPAQVVQAFRLLLTSPQKLVTIADNGQLRMGKPGAASRIAQHLKATLFSQSTTS